MNSKKLSLILTLVFAYYFAFSQVVPVINYSTNVSGQVQLEVASSVDNYYILNVRHSPTGPFEVNSSMTMGEAGTTVISEPLEAYPADYYQVLEYPIATPIDTDGDGIDDVTEFGDAPTQGPLNFAEPVSFVDGTVMVDNLTTFNEISLDDATIPWAPFLDGKEFAKFVVLDYATDQPQLYFVNTETHYTHQSFGNQIGEDVWDASVVKGEIVYYPTLMANNNTQGLFSFNFTYGEIKDFEVARKTHELIAANMPFVNNNLSFFVTTENQNLFEVDINQYNDSRIPILYEADLFADIDYLALNVAEGYGFFRLMTLDETPGSRDVVLYETIPNSLPRVGGIMTSFIQTPLSHVNLRAIQDNIPNSFIRDPLLINNITNLLDGYVHYIVEQDNYFIEEATVDEVNEWFEDLRPDGVQIPALNLSYTSILPLDEITFDMSDGFGAKCANIATMRTFDFPDGTIPDGFGIPFYFYQEFMEYNNFFPQIEAMIANPDFQADLDVRIAMLKDLRDDIKAADMPQWMLDELQDMHDLFPEGTSIRCRSSTNNEDLPGFSGAGLYTSKTQHPSEGHISKSVKQVYASIWNYRAYDERDFYRVDQYATSMGILCHPNYTDEKANGVGVSTDPIYETDNTFYLNTQVGEDLVTNPDTFSIPEEILMDRVPMGSLDYTIIRRSNLVPFNVQIMGDEYIEEMREYLSVIHDEFAILYDAVGEDGFAMDIEYKITSEDQLIIKQARPWASYWSELDPILATKELPDVRLKYFPNPVDDYLNVECDCDAVRINVSNAVGQGQIQQATSFGNNTVQIPTKNLPKGIYFLNGFGVDGELIFVRKFVKG